MTHWVNPWENAIPVTLEQLAECHMGIGMRYMANENESYIFLPYKFYWIAGKNVAISWTHTSCLSRPGIIQLAFGMVMMGTSIFLLRPIRKRFKLYLLIHCAMIG